MKTRIFDQILEVDPSDFTRFRRLCHSVIKIGFMVARDFFENLVKLQAMALAFKTLLSLTPLLAVIFSLLKAFGVHNRMEPALAEALTPLGEKGEEVATYLVGFVDKMSAGALGSVGLVTLFITVISLMATIEEAFNRIWRVKAPRRLARKFSDYLSALLVAPVLVFAALTVTATLQNNAFVHTLVSFEPFGIIILGLLRLLPYLTLWGAFIFFYYFIPNTRVKLRSAIVGGAVAALLWQTVGWGFALFVASSTHYYAIYSSFAILLLFLLWLYVGWVIVLLGAQVAYAHQHVRFYRGQREILTENPAGRERLALHLMFLIGRNFYHGFEPMSVSELAAALYLPAGLVRDFMEMFQQTRLVLPLADEQTFALARNPETIALKEIVDCVRNSGQRTRAQINRTKEENEIDEMLLDVDEAVSDALEGKTLQSFIVKLSPVPPRK